LVTTFALPVRAESSTSVHLLLVSVAMDFLLFISGGLRSGPVDGMIKIYGTKRLQLKIGKLKMLAPINYKGIMCTIVEKQ
jgi:hypothetical protein